jgi:hypothetical protein
LAVKPYCLNELGVRSKGVDFSRFSRADPVDPGVEGRWEPELT